VVAEDAEMATPRQLSASSDGLTQADVARARFDAETLGAHRWGVTREAPALPLNADGEVDLAAARARFDGATRDAWRWGALGPS